MITIDGRKMGKSYNNVIKLSELFSGTHPLLQQAYSPMAVRFSILQSHYRSPLDFSNEALQAAQKGYERLMEAYVITTELSAGWEALGDAVGTDAALVEQVMRLCHTCADYMNDDISTPKVIANLFELAPVVNSLKHQQIQSSALGKETLMLLASTFETYLITIMGLLPPRVEEADTLDGVIGVLIELRKEAKMKKDFATSDAIRDKLLAVGIQLKDEKGGGMSWSKV